MPGNAAGFPGVLEILKTSLINLAEMALFQNLRVGGRRSESVPRFIFAICLIGVDPFEDPLEDPLEEPRDDLLIFCLNI